MQVWSKVKAGYFASGIEMFWLDDTEPNVKTAGLEYACGIAEYCGALWPNRWIETFADGLHQAGECSINHLHSHCKILVAVTIPAITTAATVETARILQPMPRCAPIRWLVCVQELKVQSPLPVRVGLVCKRPGQCFGRLTFRALSNHCRCRCAPACRP